MRAERSRVDRRVLVWLLTAVVSLALCLGDPGPTTRSRGPCLSSPVPSVSAPTNIGSPQGSDTRFVSGVSTNGRYFVDQEGRPVLIKGDSPWAILQNSSPAAMEAYLRTRAAQGFNTVLVSLLGAVANGAPADNGETYDGVLPFVGGDPGNLNDAYWDRVEHFVARAASWGITVMAYPLDGWVGTSLHHGLAQSWTVMVAQGYGQAVGRRLAGYPNLLWAVGGDFDLPTDQAVDARFNAVLDGLASVGAERPTTIQFQPNLVSTESEYWDDKVDFNFVYSYARAYLMVERGYANETKENGDPLPALLGEAHYEGYEAGWEVDDFYLRQMAAWALTSGSPGEFYGSEDVWDAAPTESALRTTAVAQLGALRTVFESLKGWQNLVPDFDGSFITAGRGPKAGEGSGEYTGGDTYVTGALTSDGTLAVIYLPAATSRPSPSTLPCSAPATPHDGSTPPPARAFRRLPVRRTPRRERMRLGVRTGCSSSSPARHGDTGPGLCGIRPV